jgi:hypothetical protein
MSTLEIFMAILGVLSIIVSTLRLIATWSESRPKASKKYTAKFLDYSAITNALRASVSDKYSKQQTEVVARIVWTYSAVPLTAILRIPEERYNLYRGLSDPNQYPSDTKESEYAK